MPNFGAELRPIRDRFDKKYEAVKAGGCWIWTASLTTNGYGHIWANHRLEQAHRVSWMLHKGPIPNGLCVLHRCDVPACVNPAHLFLGTHADNMADRNLKGRASGGHNGGGPSGEANGNAKITAQQVAEIRALAGKMTQRAIGVRFGLSESYVGKIVNGKRWSQAILKESYLLDDEPTASAR